MLNLESISKKSIILFFLKKIKRLKFINNELIDDNYKLKDNLKSYCTIKHRCKVYKDKYKSLEKKHRNLHMQYNQLLLKYKK